MNRRFLVAVVALCLTTAAVAQGPAAGRGTKGMDPAKHVAKMTEQLNLTPDQQSKITTLLQNQQQQVQAVRRDAALPQGEAKQRIETIRRDTHQQLQAVLTPEQQQKLQSRKMMQAHGRGVRKGFAMGKMHESLNLTPEQSDRFKAISEQQHQQMQTIKNDTSLTQEQKRDKMRQIQQDFKNQKLAILTPEQQQKMRDFQSKHKRRGAGPAMRQQL